MLRSGRRTAGTPCPPTGTWSAQRSRTTATAGGWAAAQASFSPSTRALLRSLGAGFLKGALLSWVGVSLWLVFPWFLLKQHSYQPARLMRRLARHGPSKAPGQQRSSPCSAARPAVWMP